MKAKMAEEKEKLRAEKRHHQVSVLTVFFVLLHIYMAIIREQQTEVPSARNATDSHACAYLSKVDDEKHFLR